MFLTFSKVGAIHLVPISLLSLLQIVLNQLLKDLKSRLEKSLSVYTVFFHVMKNVRAKLLYFKNATHKNQILSDIRCMQLADSKEEFEICKKLFVSK